MLGLNVPELQKTQLLPDKYVPAGQVTTPDVGAKAGIDAGVNAGVATGARVGDPGSGVGRAEGGAEGLAVGLDEVLELGAFVIGAKVGLP